MKFENYNHKNILKLIDELFTNKTKAEILRTLYKTSNIELKIFNDACREVLFQCGIHMEKICKSFNEYMFISDEYILDDEMYEFYSYIELASRTILASSYSKGV